MDRMFCYLWSKTDGECKFGERFVKDGLDPQKDCEKRVYESIGVTKKVDFPEIQQRGIQIWDVSELAESLGRNRKGGRMDDYIRKFIGFRLDNKSEFHTIPQELMSIKVSKFLSENGQQLISAGLSTDQYDQAEKVVDAYNNGSRTILSELCARFGKTIWSSAVATETEQELVVVSSYVKTVFASFASDIARFEQFKEYVHVDTGEADYQQKIRQAFKDGKKVFAYLSLCGGGKRQERIDFLFSLRKRRMLIVDEADFGAHTDNQSMPLQAARKKSDFVLIMTGTNSDRAASTWNVDFMTSKTYPELLVSKREAMAA
jgi:hypothetical protein